MPSTSPPGPVAEDAPASKSARNEIAALMANLWFAPVIQIQRDCEGQKFEVSEVAPFAEKSINRWTAATIRSSIKMASNGFLLLCM
ncbi:hypothetical protein [Pararhizobium antarcticum]|uniref:hypothetical protein n=1 Tax=Pararhizobium antarcticum TaxID=1798805 RepID=UPI001587B8C1|nr:hypothetical protein [Pararhizobium antarcticum]